MSEVRLVAMSEETCRSLIQASEAWGGLLGNTPRNLLDNGWDSAITAEEVEAILHWTIGEIEANSCNEHEDICDICRARDKLRSMFPSQGGESDG